MEQIMNPFRMFWITLILFYCNASEGFSWNWFWSSKTKDKTYRVCEFIDDGDSPNDLKFQLLRAARSGQLEQVKTILTSVKNDTKRWSSPDKFITSGWVDTACDRNHNTAFSLALQNAHINVARFLEETSQAKKTYAVNNKTVEICQKATILQQLFKNKIEQTKIYISELPSQRTLNDDSFIFLEGQDFTNTSCKIKFPQNFTQYILCTYEITGKNCNCKKKGANSKTCKFQEDLEKCKRQMCYYHLKPCIVESLNNYKNQVEQNLREIQDFCTPQLSSTPPVPTSETLNQVAESHNNTPSPTSHREDKDSVFIDESSSSTSSNTHESSIFVDEEETSKSSSSSNSQDEVFA